MYTAQRNYQRFSRALLSPAIASRIGVTDQQALIALRRDQ